MSPSSKTQLAQLLSWQNKIGIDFWTHGGVSNPSRVMVSPEIGPSFVQFLTSNYINYKLTIEDVEQSLQRDKIAQSKRVSKLSDQPNFELYWKYDEISYYLEQLAVKYPNLVKKDVIGKTFEMRDIIGIRVSKNSQFGLNPIIFIGMLKFKSPEKSQILYLNL